MRPPATITLAGQRYLWRDILAVRKAQRVEARKAVQPTLFEMKEDRRPLSERAASGRFAEPGLFDRSA